MPGVLVQPPALPFAARALIGFFVLTVVLAPLRTAASAAQAQEARVALEARWLVLRKEDVNADWVVQVPDRVSTDGRAELTIRQFNPEWKGREDPPPVPLLTIDKLWLANDVATAQQIFQEQANAGFPEAPGRVDSVGGIAHPSLGEEARGVGGCGPCDGGIRHYRIVFRYLNAVHAIYTYGTSEFAHEGVAVNLARILDERVRAVPLGPPPDVMKTVAPRQVALSVLELGKEIDTAGDGEGSDDRSQWYWSRFKRLREKETAHIGPLDIYNKVWVARDIDTARGIFAEQSLTSFPEANATVGDGQFAMENLPIAGNENFGWSACNENCNTEFFRYLHHRYVFRSGNVVVVIYTWGGNQDNSVDQVAVYAQAMRGRM